MADDGISPVRVGFAIAGVAMTVFTILHGTGALAQTAVAQEASVAPPAAREGAVASVTGLDRPTLDAFARATRIVSALRNEYSPRIAAANIAGRPERAEALFDEMRARMHDAIDAAGLTIERYEAIAARAEHDNALRARIEAILTGGAPEPGLGVRAPAPAVEADSIDAALADARAEVEALHRRLDGERSRAREERERAAAEAAALRGTLEAAIARLTEQLAVQTREDASRDQAHGAALQAAVARERAAAGAVRAQAEVALTRAELERAAQRRDITRMARELEGAVAALAALGEDLTREPAATGTAPLTRLEPVDRPVLLAGRLPTLARDLTAVQARDGLLARLEAEKNRNLTLRAGHAAERVGLRREIARIGRDLSATMDGLTALGGLDGADAARVTTPAGSEAPDAPGADDMAVRAVARVKQATETVSDPMHDAETYAFEAMPAVDLPGAAPPRAVIEAEEVTARIMVPGSVAEVLREPVRGQPEAPAISAPSVPPAPVIRSGSVLAGIRAYEVKDYARAYAIWLPLAEAGRASAQFHLGALYFEGRGIDRDLSEARRWLRLALAQGQERARFLLGRVEAQIDKSSG